ncbi:MAG: glutamine-hydrolyzing GMP synthase, partial [Prochlorococcaceae cyanobacterium]
MSHQSPSTEQPESSRLPAIVILDFGSQYSELIARRVRETEVYSLVLGYATSVEEIRRLAPKGIILSGGPSSVYDEGAPLCDPAIWSLGIPVLGVCYGMQLMVQQLGGQVEAAGRGEYGKAPLYVDDPIDLLTNVEQGSTMWMSHGDSVQALPPGFSRLAHTDNTPEAAVADHQRRLYGVQFHPEVVHSRGGMAMIRNFVYHICGCEADWTTAAFIDEALADVRERVGDKRVLLALSGGVDSSTLAFLLHRAIGDQLTCMFIDQGFMRKGEPEFLTEFFDAQFHIRVEYINARDRFLAKLEGVTDPEQKRKIIGGEFIRVFEEESRRLGPFDYLAQGTLYPDVIESAGTNLDPKTGERVAVKIK